MSGYLLLVVVALAACLAWVRSRLVVVVVEGSSMLPTLRPGDRVLVRRTSIGRIRAGQIVVLRRTQSWIIKRAAALPGEPWCEAPVPPGWLAVLGDNEASSADSREFGLVPAASVLGAVVRRLSTRGGPGGG
jgi:signal peptidase I